MKPSGGCWIRASWPRPAGIQRPRFSRPRPATHCWAFGFAGSTAAPGKGCPRMSYARRAVRSSSGAISASRSSFSPGRCGPRGTARSCARWQDALARCARDDCSCATPTSTIARDCSFRWRPSSCAPRPRRCRVSGRARSPPAPARRMAAGPCAGRTMSAGGSRSAGERSPSAALRHGAGSPARWPAIMRSSGLKAMAPTEE